MATTGMSGAKITYTMRERERFLLALGLAGASLVLVNHVAYPTGTLIAGGILFLWLIHSGAADYAALVTNHVVSRVGSSKP